MNELLIQAMKLHLGINSYVQKASFGPIRTR